MTIAVVCNDTRGSVQAYLALSRGLARTGHAVRAIAPAAFSDAFVTFAPLFWWPLGIGDRQA